MAGLGAGLSTLGGLGSFFNPPQTNINYGSPQSQQPAPPTTTTVQSPPPSFQQGFGF
jgi:hypothetical protein